MSDGEIDRLRAENARLKKQLAVVQTALGNIESELTTFTNGCQRVTQEVYVVRNQPVIAALSTKRQIALLGEALANC